MHFVKKLCPIIFFFFSLELLPQEKIFLGIDSLTEGAGGTSYRNFFCQDSLVHYLGLIPIDYKSTFDAGISVSFTTNIKWMDSLKHSDFPKKYSLDGKGIFSRKAHNDLSVFNTSKIKNYKSIGVFFLCHPEGGTFSLNYGLKGVRSDTLNVNTDSKKTKIGYIEIKCKSSDRFYLNNVNGNVVVFGLFFKPIDSKYKTVNTLAKGGLKLNDFMSLDRDFRKKWFSLLEPTIFILNAGMNDKSTITPEIFKKNLKDFISDLKKGAPKCRIILIEPNESFDYLSSYMPKYREIRRNISKNTRDVFYYSIPDKIGNYNYFVQNGLMLDQVHPNDNGNKIIGERLYQFYKKISTYD